MKVPYYSIYTNPRFAPYQQTKGRPASQPVQSEPDWMSELLRESERREKKTAEREAEIRALYDEMVRRYSPGGEFEKKSLAEIERRGERFVEKGYGEGLQSAISRGMFGTTYTGGLKGRLRGQYEEEIGAPSRLRLEDLLMQRLTSAQQGLAGFLERQEDVGPSLSDIYGMARDYGKTEPMTFSRTYGDRGGRDDSLIDIPLPTRRETPTVKGRERPDIRKELKEKRGGVDDVMSKAHMLYVQDVRRVHPGVSTSFITLDYYKDLLKKTPKNPGRGVWKAYKQAGGSV